MVQPPRGARPSRRRAAIVPGYNCDTGVTKKPFAVPETLAGRDPAVDIGFPGVFPFTRGIQPTMYRGRLWTRRRDVGFGTASESYQRYR